MAILTAKGTPRAPYLFFEEDRQEGEGHVWGKRSRRVLLKLGLIVVCTLMILAVVLVVPVTSGSLSA
jgi:hypothetical protein